MSNSKLSAGIIAGVAMFMMALGGVFFARSVDAPGESASVHWEPETMVADQAMPAVYPPAGVEQLSDKPGPVPTGTNRPTFDPASGQNGAAAPDAPPNHEPNQRTDSLPGTPPVPPQENTVAQAGSAEAVERRRVQIQDAFRGQMDSFRECYELILELEPSLSDRLVLELLVRAGDSKPTTELISIESGRMDVEHIECFAEAATQMQMPAPDGAAEYTVRYPVVLSPRE